MKNLKHLFTALLLLCATVATAHDFEVGGIYYNITSTTDFTVEVTYRGYYYYEYSDEYSGNVVIPESVTYKGFTCRVTSIGEDAFRDCSGLTRVVIPNSVTSIGEDAFYGCSGLKEVHISDLSAWCGIDFESSSANPLCYAHNLYLNGELVTDLVIPDGVTEIKGSAFYACSGLTSVVIPNSVTSIGSYAFRGCSALTNVVIPNSVTSIEDYAFYNCSGLTSVEIPNSVTSIGESAFAGTAWYNNQPDGVVYAGRVLYKYKGTMSSNTSIAIKDGTLGIGGSAFEDCTGLTSVEIPNGVTSIGEWAFYECSGLASVVIPNSVTSIGDGAFYGCSGLTGVVIGNGVTGIGEEVFSYCSGLTSVEIPNSVTSIGGFAFLGCDGLTSIEIGNSVTSIGEDAFRDCSGLTSVVIPNSVTSIGDYAFSYCSSLTSVEIPNSVTSIGSSAFDGCSGLKKVINFSSLTFSKGSTDYGYVAYYAETVINAPNGSVEGDFVFDVIDGVNTLCLYVGAGGDVTLPADYKGENYVIGADAFSYCSGLTSVVIPNSVTSIGSSAFRGCSDLEYIYISSTIESIGDYAFAECNNIFDIKIGSKKAVAASENVFSSDAYNNACLYVPAGRKVFYAKTSPWSNFIIQETDFTGIYEVKGENGKVKDVYYDLNGRAVERPANGLYIKNGKKVFVK